MGKSCTDYLLKLQERTKREGGESKSYDSLWTAVTAAAAVSIVVSIVVAAAAAAAAPPPPPPPPRRPRRRPSQPAKKQVIGAPFCRALLSVQWLLLLILPQPFYVRNFSLIWTILFSSFDRPLTLISVFNIVYFTLNIF